ncbi:MAG: hypothetical protein IIV40_04835 [Oscillospiraceae bacterium]|nr:hypothetical protein [Oscillospiraceae bacterium]
MDWQAIKTEYITTDTSYRKLAAKYGVSYTAIGDKSRKEGWVEKRQQFLNDTISKTIANAGKKQVDRMKRILDVSDRLLEKIEKAVEELDLHFATQKTKTKVIEYNNRERPDKPTKEIIEEEEKLVEFVSIIDRKGLQAVTEALRNLKDVQMLKSELDKQEQEARIAKLQKEAKSDDETKEIRVVMDSSLEDYCK